jgi:acetoin utilization protein AcuC
VKPTLAIFYREELKEYDFGPGHPFRGDRYTAFPGFLKKNLSQDANYRFLQSKSASDEDLSLICNKDYIDFTKEYFKRANLGLICDDEFYGFHSPDNRPVGKPGKIEEAARLIVGQGKMAVDLVQTGAFKKAVSIGGGMHHAKPGYGEGFCIYNDVAFVAKYLIKKYCLRKILVLDTDAHAGNGTYEYFCEDPRVLFIDLHQDPLTLYPGTGFAYQIGEGEGKGFKVNVPMPVYAGYDSYSLIFEEIVQPLAQEFRPQIVIRNGGSDPHFADQLTNLGLPVSGFRMIGDRVRMIAKMCDEKVIDLIASGYNKHVLPYAWLALISGLANFEIEIKESVAIPNRLRKDHSLAQTKKMIQEVKGSFKHYWSCLN